MLSMEWFSLQELAQQLGRDQREIEKLVMRGRIPGRKIGDEWQFHPLEVTDWLEREMRAFTDRELAQVESSQHSEEVGNQLPISSLLKPELVEIPLQARTKRSVLEGMIEVAGRSWQIYAPAKILKAVIMREEAMSTAFENGVAIPHSRNPIPEELGESVIAFGRTLSGIPFGAPNGSLTDCFFLVLCRDASTHLKILARLGRLLQKPDFVEGIRNIEDPTQFCEFVAAAEQNIVL